LRRWFWWRVPFGLARLGRLRVPFRPAVPGGRMTPREQRLARRRARARELRDEGLSVRQIAGRLGVGRGTVGRDLLVTARESPGREVPNRAGPGNARAVTHGAHRPEIVETRARELVPAILEANGHLDAVRDGAAVARYAMTLARVELVYRWLGGRGDPVFVDADLGVAHGIYGRLEQWERACDRAEDRLAIAPLTRARLGLDLLTARRSLEDEIAESRDVWASHGVAGEVSGESS
jgi:transposase